MTDQPHRPHPLALLAAYAAAAVKRHRTPKAVDPDAPVRGRRRADGPRRRRRDPATPHIRPYGTGDNPDAYQPAE